MGICIHAFDIQWSYIPNFLHLFHIMDRFRTSVGLLSPIFDTIWVFIMRNSHFLIPVGCRYLTGLFVVNII